jgi:hypothetical protein
MLTDFTVPAWYKRLALGVLLFCVVCLSAYLALIYWGDFNDERTKEIVEFLRGLVQGAILAVITASVAPMFLFREATPLPQTVAEIVSDQLVPRQPPPAPHGPQQLVASEQTGSGGKGKGKAKGKGKGKGR